MQTRIPAPVEPPSAQSRVTRSGHSTPIPISADAAAGRLQAGSVSPVYRSGFSSGCATDRSYGVDPGLGICEAPAQRVKERPLGLVALLRQRCLEVGDERLTELGVRFRPSDDAVELAAGDRQLLCSSHPRFGRWRKGSDQLSQSVFVEYAHTLTCPPD